MTMRNRLSHGASRRSSPALVEPLAPSRYKVSFSASAELHEKLERLGALMPGVDLAQIVEQAVTEKLERLEARRFAKTKAPRKATLEGGERPSSRYIPAPIRRAVYERDGGRCRFVDARGRRCSARRHLEFHHLDPYARGGAHSVGNVQLACAGHNAYLAERDYGEATMAQYRHRPGRDNEA